MIPRDKQLHFGAGVVIGLLAGFFGWWAMGLVVIAAVGKEARDKISGKGTPEILDAVATLLGGAVSVLAVQFLSGRL